MLQQVVNSVQKNEVAMKTVFTMKLKDMETMQVVHQTKLQIMHEIARIFMLFGMKWKTDQYKDLSINLPLSKRVSLIQPGKMNLSKIQQ